MKKIVLLSVLVAMLFSSSSCSNMSRREKETVGAVVTFGIIIAAIIALGHHSNDNHHGHHHGHYHGHGRH